MKGRMLPGISVLSALVVAAATTEAAGQAGPSGGGSGFASYCLDCHEGAKAKGGLDLGELLASASAAPGARDSWEVVLLRLRRGDMPPMTEEEQPSQEQRGRLLAEARAAWEETWGDGAPERTRSPRTPLTRRLTRDEWSRSVHDLLGVEVDVEMVLPEDEIGEGFTTTADTLTISPLHVERYLAAAELAAIVATAGPQGTLIQGTPLSAEGGGRVDGGVVRLHSAGDAITTFRLRSPFSGELVIRAAGQQAGDEPVRLSAGINRRLLGTFSVRETPEDPGEFRIACELAPGEHEARVRFINDFYRPDHPDPSQRDRNAQVVAIELRQQTTDGEGSAFQQGMENVSKGGRKSPALERVVGWLTERAWRGEAPREERARVAAAVRRVQRAAGSDDAIDAQRAAIVAVLCHPRFLYRIETEPGSPQEYAARLASFLWGSIPDERLRQAAEDGSLASREGAAREVRRLLDDHRSRSLAERFATQWLQIDRLETQTFDGEKFGALDGPMRAAIREETIEYFDWILRSGAPVSALVRSRTRVRNAALAAYYGEEPLTGDELQIVASDTGEGLLRHGSVLAATSLPTRTSPVIRGKFILEALLDRPPAPPPPEIPKLEESARVDGRTLSMREQLEHHRADPSCAACHHTMDELGFALQSRDAIGRRVRIRHVTREGDQEIVEWRVAQVDDRGRLPGGATLDGIEGLEQFLSDDPALRRSLIRHMAVFALGRRTAEVDSPTLDEIDRIGITDPSLRSIVVELALSESFAGPLTR
ncbi:MAG: DUF1592 domain-containing protein [Planctomycetota bacterium]|nr:DUF1592 domain-containing protein [Planctomycetota bacterium]MDA1106251.1 DUF1592 domain-containing protein [Planctomycetota bacterium]